jgi:hypothetical protein
VAKVERPSTPLWWYGLVAIAAVLAGLWLISTAIGFVFGLVKVVVVVVLAIAIIGWAVGKKTSR